MRSTAGPRPRPANPCSRTAWTTSSSSTACPLPTLLKVDVDGAEAAVLSGALRTLAQRGPPLDPRRDRAESERRARLDPLRGRVRRPGARRGTRRRAAAGRLVRDLRTQLSGRYHGSGAGSGRCQWTEPEPRQLIGRSVSCSSSRTPGACGRSGRWSSRWQTGPQPHDCREGDQVDRVGGGAPAAGRGPSGRHAHRPPVRVSARLERPGEGHPARRSTTSATRSRVYRDATKLRARAERLAPGFVRWPCAVRSGPRGARALRARALRARRPLPRSASPRVEAFLAEQRPDVLMVHPADRLRLEPGGHRSRGEAARHPACCLSRFASWDNLTNKGLLRDAARPRARLERRCRRHEAVELHGVPAESRPSHGRSRVRPLVRLAAGTQPRGVLREVGLDVDRPIVLYAGSSQFIAPDEPDVRPAVDRRRYVRHGGAIREAGILVRPHPARRGALPRASRSTTRRSSVWPPLGQEFPLDDDGRQNYFDSIYHSDAVVGINTSAHDRERRSSGGPSTRSSPRSSRQTQRGHHPLPLPRRRGVRARANGSHARGARRAAERSLADGDAEGLNERFMLRRLSGPYGLDVAATPLDVRGDRGAGRGSGAGAPALARRCAARPVGAEPGGRANQTRAQAAQAGRAGYRRVVSRRSLSRGASGRRTRSSFASAATARCSHLRARSSAFSTRRLSFSISYR